MISDIFSVLDLFPLTGDNVLFIKDDSGHAADRRDHSLMSYRDLLDSNKVFECIYSFCDVSSSVSEFCTGVRKHLSQNGKLIAFIPNRFGSKYLCGSPDPSSHIPFDGIVDSSEHRYNKNEVIEAAKSAGFTNIRFYYPFPDLEEPSLIYTDDYKPGQELAEKLSINIDDPGSRVMNERDFIIAAAKAGNAEFFTNTFIVECTDGECSDLIYSCITSSRRKERAFATCIFKGNTVQKIPLYDEGRESLKKMVSYTNEMISHGIPALQIKYFYGKGVMERIFAPTLSDYIRDNIRTKDELIYYTDKLFDYINKSSEKTEHLSEYFAELGSRKDTGVILERAYFEMIPVNCFVKGKDLLFFDQEYAIDNCPALFIMFRCVHDIYMFIPAVDKIMPQQEMKDRYGLSELWEDFIRIEAGILRKGYSDNSDNIRVTMSDDVSAITKNRMMLKMNGETHREMYELFSDYNDEKIILFGSGIYSDYYLDKYEKSHRPEFIVDNNPDKQGTTKRGIEIKPPDALKELVYGTYRVIIAVSQFFPIAEQLESMGIGLANYRIYNRKIDPLLNDSISDTMSDGKYNIGYIPGAFDLFHIGHLNILRRSKERCHYLIAGVLTDELIREEKHKEPFIPFEERFEIVKQCKFVDRAIAVDKHNTDKLDAFKELHFGCMFSGSDHDEGYKSLQQLLRVVGSNLEIFPYTESTSSTMLQEMIKNQVRMEK